MSSEMIVLDDVVKLAAGDQVPSDMVVISGFVEANEALLTGESDLIKKKQMLSYYQEVLFQVGNVMLE